MRKSRGVEKREWVTALRAVVLGTVGGSLAVFLLLVASAYAFVTMKKIPQAAVPIIILFLSALGALLSGFLTARIAGKRGLPLGPSVVSSFCCCRDLHLHCCLLAGNNNANVGHDPCRGAGGIWRHPKEMIEK